MTWHLKDRELERKLIAIDSGFLEKLNEACEKLDNNKDGDFPEHKRFAITLGNNNIDVIFNGSHVKKRSDYDPKIWNEYPEVTPPEGILMRVETAFDSATYRECAIFDKGAWKKDRDGKPTHLLLSEVKRFRPWED